MTSFERRSSAKIRHLAGILGYTAVRVSFRGSEDIMNLEYVSLGILILVVLILFYGIIVIHDIPYEIAVKRNHPHQDVLHVAGWVSLFTLHAIWPFLWIWAMMYHDDRGWGLETGPGNDESLKQRLDDIEARLSQLEPAEGE